MCIADYLSNTIKKYLNDSRYVNLINNYNKQDLFGNISSNLTNIIKDAPLSDSPKLKIVLGQAGAGKSFLTDSIDNIKDYINHDLDEWRKDTLYHKNKLKTYKNGLLDNSMSEDYAKHTMGETMLMGDVLSLKS